MIIVLTASMILNIFLAIKYVTVKLIYTGIVYYCIEKGYEINPYAVKTAMTKVLEHFYMDLFKGSKKY